MLVFERDAVGALPDVDLVFERFKDTDKLPPDNKALAASHVAQQVTIVDCVADCVAETLGRHSPHCVCMHWLGCTLSTLLSHSVRHAQCFGTALCRAQLPCNSHMLLQPF